MVARMNESSTRPSFLVRTAIEHPWRVVLAWLVLVVVAAAIVVTMLGDSLDTAEETTNDPESQQALTQLDEHFGDRERSHEVVVVSSKRHRVGSPAFDAFLADLVRQGSDIGVTIATPDAGAGADERAGAGAGAAAPPTSRDGHAVLIPLDVTAEDEDDAVDRLVDAVDDADHDPDFAVAVTGARTVDHDFQELSARDLQQGELYVGLPVALVVLLLVFGTVVGAGLPLLIAVVSIVCALALAALVGTQVSLSVFLVNMVSGMGLALGIDYSLFVLSRYREERTAGSSRDAAIRTTGATASRAVLFSGITFVVALCGMLLVPTTIMRSLAAGAILVGIVAVAAALTLLPALLRLLGDRVDALPVPLVGRRRRGATAEVAGDGRWFRLVRRVMRRPVVWGGSVVVLLLLATIPLLGIRTGSAGVGTFPEDLASRRGFDALQEHFPEAAYNPARIVVSDPHLDRRAVDRGIDSLRTRLRGDDRFGAPEVTRSDDGQVVMVAVPVGADSLAPSAVAAVRDLRAHILPKAFRGLPGSAKVQVTGDTALNIDYFDVMRDWLPIVLAFVLGLSFLVLLVVFRSLTAPIVAIVLNLLSVGATYGLLVLVFQHGVGADLLGLRQVDVTEAWVPLFLFSVLFGLSMDYHMFLLTRIREHWSRDGDTRAAVEWGVGSTGRLITGAALIIVAVFIGFAVGDLVMFQQMGFGVGVALLIDATLVRGVLLPAAMALLGEHNWYLPRWLEWLPEVQLETESGPARTQAPTD
ncbi:MAG: hypothetical protein JWM98_1422 [Thermoleophilia bacterium]|nr:hypothetical protein [Thermoleophilia bacterium]